MGRKFEIEINDTIIVNHTEIKAIKRTGWQGCESCYFHKFPGSCKRFPCNAHERKDGNNIKFVENDNKG
ncbi:hypothetical protein PD491P1_00031 [Parabacteroides phage PD491P1]|jgi:hypothetical protein|nr:MAG: hypothetical protein [Bacteriophage sp.]UVX57526.1 MAG: hypothetical protein [Bacteriophage sp.]UVX62534.1 MAG: hypothetical protein [Bacteriophage sp.]WAX16858.1 hypothetical protein PD491P1_00031 [Parabacteroides phage PD491P1]